MYRIVANTSDEPDFGAWNVEIATHQCQLRCQDVVKSLTGEYPHVWYQSSEIEQPTDEDIQRRKEHHLRSLTNFSAS